ncbi:MAG TPA: cupin domain-containing protein [Smithella sp.]|nr:cupin domain-containing protein [Smithella sp.]HNY49646.1 cupin domain-containing protein [Smithella sp.]HOG90629.1 cupin domain-containing protein [Smithella sp.]
MKAKIKKQNLNAEFYMAEGCFITELSNSADDPAVSIARARVEPGVTTRRHRLQGITERYFIISGKGRVEIGDLPPQEVNSGDVVLIPPMCPQRIANIGKEDLIFLAICSPRYTQDVYEDVEDING